jgi:hypothetical protein
MAEIDDELGKDRLVKAKLGTQLSQACRGSHRAQHEDSRIAGDESDQQEAHEQYPDKLGHYENEPASQV